MVDVRAELNALEAGEAVEELPEALVHPHTGVVMRESGRVCVSAPALGVFLGAGGVFLFVALAAFFASLAKGASAASKA